jgi:hypothetical protein
MLLSLASPLSSPFIHFSSSNTVCFFRLLRLFHRPSFTSLLAILYASFACFASFIALHSSSLTQPLLPRPSLTSPFTNLTSLLAHCAFLCMSPLLPLSCIAYFFPRSLCIPSGCRLSFLSRRSLTFFPRSLCIPGDCHRRRRIPVSCWRHRWRHRISPVVTLGVRFRSQGGGSQSEKV